MFVIYGLEDPRDHTIRYVGMTKNLYARTVAHASCLGTNMRQVAWIRSLQEVGLTFGVLQFESVVTVSQARVRERYWIDYCLREEEPLTNIMLVPNPSAKFKDFMLNVQGKGQKLTDKGRQAINAIYEYGVDNVLLDLPVIASELKMDERTLKTWLNRFIEAGLQSA